MNTMELLFQLEIFYNFFDNIQKPHENFWFVELEHGFVGFSFHEAEHAKAMHELVCMKTRSYSLDEKAQKKNLKRQNKILNTDCNTSIFGKAKDYFHGFMKNIGLETQQQHSKVVSIEQDL